MFHVNTSWWFCCRLWMLANKKTHNLHNQIGHTDDHVVDKSKNSNDVMQEKKFTLNKMKNRLSKWQPQNLISQSTNREKITSLFFVVFKWKLIVYQSNWCALLMSLKSPWLPLSSARMGKKAKNRAKQQWKTHRERKNDCIDHNIYK